MAELEATIQITGLPPHRGLVIHVCLFAVENSNAPPPYNGDPPPEAVTDSDQVVNQVDLERELTNTTYEHEFALERRPGHYYVQLRVILFRVQNGKTFAQAEQFFFGRRSLHLSAESNDYVTFPVAWPSQSLSELHVYGKVSPQNRRPWWRFW